MQQVFDSEKFCVSLSEKILSKEAKPIAVHSLDGGPYDAKKSFGIFTHSDGGQILHCLDFRDGVAEPVEASDLSEISAFFEDYFSKTKKSIFSIIGEKRGTETIRYAIEKTKGIKAEHIQEYFLMEGTPEDFETPFISRLKKATEKDLQKLSKMQFDYENEEVAYKSRQIDKKTSELSLKKNISKGRVYYFLDSGKVVSKLSINAIGKNYIQIGGVFTKVEHRKKGFAKALISEFLAAQKGTGKGVVLFVKKENLAARRLYETLDFKTIGEFEIVYF